MNSSAASALVCLSVLAVIPSVCDAQCSVPMCFGCGSTYIDCTGASLTAFPAFPDAVTEQVETLILKANQLSIIYATDLRNFSSLRELDISINYISSIEEDSFINNTVLDTLNLEDNQLNELPDHLFRNTQLSILKLQNNNIERISAATFIGMIESSTILLNNNNITKVPNGTFSELQLPRKISLGGNPLHCDCELQWLPELISSFEVIVDTTVSAETCDTPMAVNGRSLDSLDPSQFICECPSVCINGSCSTFSGACDCNAGYTGENCSIECPIGWFGQDCAQMCECQNGAICDFVTGKCICSSGWTGMNCDTKCPPEQYGLKCSSACTCEMGSCHHVFGNCSCFVGYYGPNCSHGCSLAPDCGLLGRESCSLSTPEHTCGPCLVRNTTQPGNSSCTNITVTTTVYYEYTTEPTSTPDSEKSLSVSLIFISERNSTVSSIEPTSTPDSEKSLSVSLIFISERNSTVSSIEPTSTPDSEKSLPVSLIFIVSTLLPLAVLLVILIVGSGIIITTLLYWKHLQSFKRNKVKPANEITESVPTEVDV